MSDDYVLRIIKSIGEAAAKVFKKENVKELKNIDINSMSKNDILPVLLKHLVLQGKYNEAENILFEELNKNPSNNLINIGKDFYSMLNSKSDEELTKAHFSREEISQGLNDMKKIKNI